MIEFDDLPDLVDPVVIAAFEGWNDAGEAASSLVEHLAQLWDAVPVAAIDPEDYYDFQVNRPRVANEDGRRRLSWPTTRLLHAPRALGGRDVILVQGIEPSTRWRSFVVELLEAITDIDAVLVVALGALLADVPHTRPCPVSVFSEDARLTHRLGLEEPTYEGPTGIVGVLADAAAQNDLPTLSCWVSVPHYAGGTPSPKATLALLSRLEDVLEATIDRGELEELSKAWERGVDELAASDEEVSEYVQALEEAQDTADHPEASGDAIAREFERYLRRRDDPGETDRPAGS
ncbi:PAC2 family protein [Agilicoccus flavus]|uniref:PAC2 family protein n=1 Tax=Agilicoccus flavus TaxID=2775968 RepID=UPI001CF652C5|nr:PAC2 family protein [Agilicoccus flavus]